MSNTTSKTKAASNGKAAAADVTKDFEVLMTANRKTLQDAFKSSTDAAEKAFKTSSEAFKTTYEKALKDGKDQVEKAAKTFSEVSPYDNESAESFMTVGKAAVEKGEKISAEIVEFSTGRVNEYFSVARSLIDADDVQKAIELQSEYARTSVESYVSEFGKLNTMMIDATKSLMEPFGAQYAANMDKFLNRA
ncbi:MAG: phasin family protein [Sneathiellales bacterium]|nr:phasin family protein [Sneathiellales bacterium]